MPDSLTTRRCPACGGASPTCPRCEGVGVVPKVETKEQIAAWLRAAQTKHEELDVMAEAQAQTDEGERG